MVADNASTDKTAEICSRYAELDNRVRFIRNSKNIGAPANYNLTFHRSTGKYFKWSAASDVCSPNMFSACVNVLERHPDVVLVYARTLLFAETIDLHEEFLERVCLESEDAMHRFRSLLGLGRNNIMNGVYRSSALRKTQLHQPYYSSDTVMLAELVLHGRAIQLDDAFYYRRMTSQTTADLGGEAVELAHWTPDRQRPLRLQTWRYFVGLIKGVLRARPSPRIVIFGLGWALRRALWSRKQLLVELRNAFSTDIRK